MWLFLVFLVGKTLAYTGAVMGVQTPCDDGQTGINIDWNPKDYSEFTCPNAYQFVAQTDVDPLYFDLRAINASFNPKTDQVGHKCIHEKLVYKEIPPLRWEGIQKLKKKVLEVTTGRIGPGMESISTFHHRDGFTISRDNYTHSWPDCGTKKDSRNIFQHGTVVLLYHPCVSREELDRLRQLVTGCLWRHVITPYNKLSQQRPLALVSWGAKLEMNVVNDQQVVGFIRKHARNAPEDIERDGIYNQYLIHPAQVVSDAKDNSLCPSFNA